MVSDKAKKRMEVIAFWERHGESATLEAFKISRRTLYAWRAQLKNGGGKAESLNEKSRRPHKVRFRQWPVVITSEIRRVRTAHPNLGKEKIFIHLQAFCRERSLVCPGKKTIGRLIADQPDKMRTFPQKVRHDGTVVKPTRKKKDRKPKGFLALHPGHCVALDTIEFHFWGRRIYVITFVDLYSRWAFAHVTTSHASKAASEFFEICRELFPYSMEHVLTDNGSEFLKDFDENLRRLHLIHWSTYPKTPKMNAHAERFNRTIQEEFFIVNRVLFHNLPHCTLKLNEYLNWYNHERPHHSLKLLSPKQFIHNWEQTRLNVQECRM
jgi:transposase InsO family protein